MLNTHLSKKGSVVESWPQKRDHKLFRQSCSKNNSKASLDALDFTIKSFTVGQDLSQYENTGVKADKRSYLL